MITGLMMVVAVLAMAFLAPETKGSSLEQANPAVDSRIRVQDATS